jgi:16S rRNA (cytosine967-C5)-methyltransferase
MPVSPARAAAFAILLRVEKTDAYASELLHSSHLNALSPADHGLATELVMGVLRWRSVLDSHIAEHATQAIAKLDLEVLTALRLGTYQLLFLSRIPRHAAVNESVELVKHARKRSAAGMVNVVLRKTAQDSSKPSNAVSEGAAGLQCAAELQIAAHPEWLVKRWVQNYGPDPAKLICAYDQAQPHTTIRVNDSTLVEQLPAEGLKLEPGRLLAKAITVSAGEITQTSAFRERRLVIQDEASQLVALLVGKANSILDCCAAPGGKTRILAERNPDARVVALELHPHRAALLKKLVPLANVRVIAADARRIPLRDQFERVLVDAPCTGTGTLARNPEIKWRLKPEDICRLQAYQSEILRAAMEQVAPGGRLIYSTCSLEPEENSEVVEKALAINSSFRLVDCRAELLRLRQDGALQIENVDSFLSGPYLRTIPGVHQCDGFFAAILEKSSAI